MKSMRAIIPALGFFLLIQVTQADWTSPKKLTSTSGRSWWPKISVDSMSSLHVVWHDNTSGSWNIYYKKSTDGGTTWTPIKRLSSASGYSLLPDISVDSFNNIHLVWEEEYKGIYYKKSTNHGATWTASKKISKSIGEWPSIAIDSSGNIHIVWSGNTSGNEEIYYNKSSDGGVTWSTTTRLTSTSVRSNNAHIAVDPFRNLHVVWDENISGHDETYYKKSTDGGTTWTANKRLTSTSGDSWLGEIAADLMGNLHVVNADNTNADITHGNTEIYYKKGTNKGGTWAALKRLTSNSGVSGLPAIAIDSSCNLHVVWGKKKAQVVH